MKHDLTRRGITPQCNRIMWIGSALIVTLTLAGTAFAQVQVVQGVPAAPSRIPQQILINGQLVNGAYVPSASGGMQSFTCPGPQEYATPDGASHGWACFDQSTAVWLLNALPPAPQPVQQPTVVYQQAQPATVVVQQPATIVYTAPAYPVVVRPAYSPSVVIGVAAINAVGRIASAAIIRDSHYGRYYYGYPYPYRGRYR